MIAAISESVVEIVTYGILVVGAISVLALIGYAIAVFRKVSIGISHLSDLADAMCGSIGQANDTLSKLHGILSDQKLSDQKLQPRQPQQDSGLCSCGKPLKIVASTVDERGPALIWGCDACASSICVPIYRPTTDTH